jgi:hypothetical protein
MKPTKNVTDQSGSLHELGIRTGPQSVGAPEKSPVDWRHAVTIVRDSAVLENSPTIPPVVLDTELIEWHLYGRVCHQIGAEFGFGFL